MKQLLPALSLLLAFAAPFARAQHQDATLDPRPHSVVEYDDGSIVCADETGTYVYPNWKEYLRSGFFLRHGKRCGTVPLAPAPGHIDFGAQGDCSTTFTNSLAQYDPTANAATYTIPVVFHIFINTNGNGQVSDTQVNDQIAILNADFASLTNAKIRFELASVDPNGAVTTGINRYTNRRWYNDSGNYAAQVGWDTNRYLNIYSNTAGGNLGYAYIPNGGGVVGSTFDGVRLHWQTIGFTNYAPYNLGRTGTHEVGHFLGLYHTFQGGCGTSDCSRSGDLVCDTNPESSPNYNACQPSERITCGSQDPVRNYMDYSTDACMDNFTFVQANRMRCTLENWRPDLYTTGGSGGTTNPPAAPSGPTPGDGATSVATTVTLGWNTATGAADYDVYFGTSPLALSIVSVGQSGTTYVASGLTNGTTYHWQVVANNAAGSSASPVWAFATDVGGGGGTGDLPFADDFEDGDLNGWSTTGTVQIATTSLNGAFSAEIRRSGSLSITLDPGAASLVDLAWTWGASNYDLGSDTATLTVSQGGSVLGTYALTSFGVWRSEGVTGLAITPNVGVVLTFTGNANRNNERLFIDDVSVQ